MDIMLIFRIAGVGIAVSVINQLLKSSGKDEIAMLCSIAGLLVVLYWVIGYISELFRTVQSLFQF